MLREPGTSGSKHGFIAFFIFDLALHAAWDFGKNSHVEADMEASSLAQAPTLTPALT